MIMPQPNYEALVKTVYPDAWCRFVAIYDSYVIVTDETALSSVIKGTTCRNRKSAWQSAYDILRKQNKIKPQ